MRRHFLTRLLVAGALLALACTGDRNPLPTQPPSAALLPPSAAIQAQIEKLIAALFPPRLLQQAKTQFAGIKALIAQGKTAASGEKMFALVDFALKKYGNHELRGDQSATAKANLRDLVNLLFQFVGLAAPGDITAALDPGGAAAVVKPSDPPMVVETVDGQAGVDIGTGAISDQTVLVTIIPSTDQTEPLPSPLDQFPPFFDFRTSPEVPTFNEPVIVGICVDDNAIPNLDAAVHARLRLAHPHPDPDIGGVEILPLAEASFLNCPHTIGRASWEAQNLASAGWKGVLGRLASGAAGLFRPQLLHAATATMPGGLGGQTSSFSDFGAVDPNSAVGVCGAGSVEGLTTFTAFADAINTVNPGGTIRVCTGTFTVDNVIVGKPVTVEAAASSTPVIQNTTTAAFVVNGVASGTVTFRGLSFVNSGTAAVDVGSRYDQVVVDDCDFDNTPGGDEAIFAGASTVAGARVLVQNSSITGGVVGTFAASAPDFDVMNSTFSGQSFSGIQYQTNVSGRVEGNTLSACGLNGCIRAVNIGTGHVEIVSNMMTVEADRDVLWGIAADGGSHLIEANTVTGVGADETGFGVERAGIRVGRVALIAPPALPPIGNATVTHNTVTNAVKGLDARDALITGTDNVINAVSTGIFGADLFGEDLTSVTINNSDITNYVVPLDGDGLTNLTCNWWGSAAGPQNVPGGVPTSVYTPWAVAPIANGAGGSCTGGIPPAPRRWQRDERRPGMPDRGFGKGVPRPLRAAPAPSDGPARAPTITGRPRLQ